MWLSSGLSSCGAKVTGAGVAILTACTVLRVYAWNSVCATLGFQTALYADDINITITNIRGLHQNINTSHHLANVPTTKSTVLEVPFRPFHQQILLKREKLQLFIHTAFLDQRFPMVGNTVRIFGMQSMKEDLKDFRCQVVTSDGHVTDQVPASRHLIDPNWPWWGPYYACSFDCIFPNSSEPSAVYLVSRDGKYKFNVTVEKIPSISPKLPLAVFVKPVTGNLDVYKLIEWFETLRAAGIEHFIIYKLNLQGSSQFVFDYYEKLGMLTTIPFPFAEASVQNVPGKLSPGKIDAIYQQTFLVAIHDCLYRFQGIYSHLLLLDLDEILLPVKNWTLVDMVQDIEKTHKNGAGYLFFTSWHFVDHGEVTGRNIPDYLYMQRHLMGTYPIDNQPKSIFCTDTVISLNFHSAMVVPSQMYTNEIMSWKEYGYVYHFRTGRCIVKFESDICEMMLNKTRVDNLLPRYYSKVKQGVKYLLDYLQMNH